MYQCKVSVSLPLAVLCKSPSLFSFNEVVQSSIWLKSFLPMNEGCVLYLVDSEFIMCLILSLWGVDVVSESDGNELDN